MKIGFSILELIIVILILGVLVTLGLSQYGSARERALDREAQANLRLIIAAARIYRMEEGGYYAAANTAGINANYRLLLPDPATNVRWSYIATADNTATPPAFCAQATRTSDLRTWGMQVQEDDPVANNTCP